MFITKISLITYTKNKIFTNVKNSSAFKQAEHTVLYIQDVKDIGIRTDNSAFLL